MDTVTTKLAQSIACVRTPSGDTRLFIDEERFEYYIAPCGPLIDAETFGEDASLRVVWVPVIVRTS